MNNDFRFDFDSKHFNGSGSKAHNFDPSHVNIHLKKFRLIFTLSYDLIMLFFFNFLFLRIFRFRTGSIRLSNKHITRVKIQNIKIFSTRS